MGVFKRPQISLRMLLVLVAIAAVATWSLHAWHKSAVSRFESAMNSAKYEDAYRVSKQAQWLLPWDNGWARRCEESGFRFSEDRFESLGGHTSASIHDTVLVYFWNQSNFSFQYVEDLDEAIWCLHRLRNVSDIFLDERSWKMHDRLKHEFPNVKIHKQNAGII